MKEGWEYKKLGAVADFYRGLTYKREDEVDLSDNCVLRSNNIDLESMSLNFEELKYIRPDLVIPEEKKLKANSVFVCMSNGSKQHVGKVAYIKDNMDYAFGGFMGLIVPKREIEGKYIYYVCRSSLYRQFLTQIGNGIGITNLRFSDLNNFSLPVPPLSKQQHIVEELDLLSSIIEKKKTQLNELDNLAQSLFYEMFGDPITNDKGWEKKCLSELCGRVNNIRWQEVLDEKTYNYVDLTAVDRTSHCIEETTMIKKGDAPSRAKQIIRTNDVLFGTTRPTLKRVCLVNKEYNDSICSTGFCVLRPLEDFVSSKWLFHLLLSNSFYSYIEPLQSGASYPAVSDNIVKSFSACIPPIILQNQFASKIEAVEHQKELIKKSIKEVETLFSSRMDYYFI